MCSCETGHVFILVECNFNDPKPECGVFFLQPQRLSRVVVRINRRTCIWQNWWDFAMKSIYLCAQMLIYRHLTRTTLIRTFQRTKFMDVISLRYHTYAHSLLWAQCAYEGIDIFKIILLTHGNRSHYTFLLEMKLITTHFATWQQKLSLVFTKLSAEWFLQIILHSKFAHYAYHTGKGARIFICAGRVVRMCGREKWKKNHAKSFLKAFYIHTQ